MHMNQIMKLNFFNTGENPEGVYNSGHAYLRRH